MEAISAKTQMAKIRSFEKGFMATHLINMGAELGLFEALNEKKEGMNVSDLATKLGLHEPHVRIWCQTAYHFEILDADDKGRFRLQPFLDEILGDRANFRNYLGNIALVVMIGAYMKSITNSFRTGEIQEPYDIPGVSEIAYEPGRNIPLAFLYMILPKAEQIKQSLEEGVRFLDIGCGNGNFIIQLAQMFTKSTFVGIGLDGFGIESAKSSITKLGLENRVAVELMKGEEMPYENEFDMAGMVVTLHEIKPDVREEVVKKAYGALKKGSHFFVLDFPYPGKLEDFRNPAFEYGILDQFFECSGGFCHLDSQKQDEILMNAGFTNLHRMQIGKGMFDFITATK